MDTPASTAALDRFGHLLIRSACHDEFDPFFVHGPLADDRPNDHVCACFYYAVILGPTFTVLMDNQGRGNMCTMTMGELAAVWDTQELLASLGVSRADLETNRVVLPLGQAVPPPLFEGVDVYSALGDVHGDVPIQQVIQVFEALRANPDPTMSLQPTLDTLPKTTVPVKVGLDRQPLRRLRR